MPCIHGAGTACIPCARLALRTQTDASTSNKEKTTMACPLHNIEKCAYCSTQALNAQVASVYVGRKKTSEADAAPGFKGRSFRTPLHEKGIR